MSTTACGLMEGKMHERGRRGNAAAHVPRRARLVHGAAARELAAGADPADERLLLAAGRHPRAALPRARAERPLHVPAGAGARRRAGPLDGRDLHRGHRGRQSGRGLDPGPPRPRVRGSDGSALLLPRHRGVRPGRSGRAGDLLGGSAGQAPLEHAIADPVRARRRRLLVTGANGQLGRALVEAFAGEEVIELTLGDWDVSVPPPAGLRPADLVLHTAAWTDVDGAENDPQGAAAVNVGGTKHAAELGPLVYYSTDYVFEEAKLECRVVPIPTAELGRPAPRPLYSVLRSEKPEAPRLPYWREGLRECLARLADG